jgi:hypothetical protein
MRGGISWLAPLAAAIGLATAALGAAGCSTEAFCFKDCETGSTSSSGTGTGGSGGAGNCVFGCETTSSSGGGGDGGTGGQGPCVVTNDGVEQCDQLDNDCNGAVDDIPGIDLTAPETCGACNHNCLTEVTHLDPATITCNQGQCDGTCLEDYFDFDNNGPCETRCVPGTATESICNGLDDDCDGATDEDVDLCVNTSTCGACGNNCVVLHGTPECVHTGPMPCNLSNTECRIAACDCPDAQGNCWWDLDGRSGTGCEYECELTNGGVEICDGVDNDCDGLIDSTDVLTGDPRVGVSCSGDPDGECATPAHNGTTLCEGGQIVCRGPNVLTENAQPERCNGLDDDCNGAVDNNPIDAGGSCGVSANFPCSFGAFQCQGGALVCIGAVNPGVEACNGIDDDCDGVVDSSGGMPPSDSVGECDERPAPPPGVPQPCRVGAKACVGGAIVCQGSVGPSGTSDTCGVDANCDGALTNQPDLQSDVSHCGSCTHDCYSGAVHSTWSCNAGTCQFQGCAPGYYDLNGDRECEYGCEFIQATETCNGRDDNCNGVVDESLVVPSPVQVCGVSPTATRPECTSGVAVACTGGAWRCTFPAGVCNAPGGCAATTEICDGSGTNLDNNCNGLLNENVPNFGRACNSDEGLAPPGHGACRTTGVFVCNGANTTVCSATPADCSTLPGGCTERCDGIDNDCDGSVDEPFSRKGTNVANFVRPAVTQIATSLWIYSYEASRPSATNTDPGSGNGYQTTAPTGSTIDKTPACSVPTKIPWFNVSGDEAEQTCTAMGGSLCTTADWQSSCQATAPCTWGFNPRNNATSPAGTACTTAANTTTKFCNLGPTFDSNPASGDQDGLLPTASPLLQNCWADWSGLLSNTAATNKVFDITGNLRELTKKPAANQYALMGGAFDSSSDVGSACNFSFYSVDRDFKYYDTGFRCCFSTNPAL